jgi:hypothetical protein
VVTVNVGERSKAVVLHLKEPVRMVERFREAAGAAWAGVREQFEGGPGAEACWGQAPRDRISTLADSMHERFLDERHTWGELRVGEDALAFQARHEELLVGLAQQQFAAQPKPAGVTGRTAQVNGDRIGQRGYAH